MRFERVQQILNEALETWATSNGHNPDLSGHGPHFVWDSKADLLAAVGKNRRLIQPELIGTANAGQANLIIDLRVGFGGNRMPQGGPYIPCPLIDEIEQWIKDGCPD
ncbi:hypothetical protein GR211_33415 [Rhizobium leguminosarum]|uniref:hypothetical protein n=1 Tax=Rhizobium TaxID=379 RepID=UPI0013B7C429|nr:hypothetical protein [Rhizobium ruizarguesonis]NEJ17748.1 hypothetical protein [Rhizobium ruizarguesonis]NEK31726.1 hypothetical protein [Rhizobium ruizarguesonis]